MERRDTRIERDPVTGSVREERHMTGGPVDPVDEPLAAAVADSEVVSNFNPAMRGVQLIYLVFGVIIGLLLIRVLLKILVANPTAGFTTFVYGVTSFFMAPFRNLLPVVSNGQSQLEVSVVIAIFVYMLIAWVLARLIMIIFARNISIARRSRTSGLRPRGY
jgi:uncharacterized protein YggT (Ycf19 family)